MQEGMGATGVSSNAGTPPAKRNPVWVSEQGLTLLFEPINADHVVADIIFVHGLQGHPYKTWRFNKEFETKVHDQDAKATKKFRLFKKKSQPWRTVVEKKRIYWPLDLLPDDVADARIFTYGYDSHITHAFNRSTNRSNISQHGLTLLNAVSSERRSHSDRPLIFVAHSLGGLLVKQALVESWKAAQDGQHRNLHQMCRAIIFFGTPHRGSSDASWGLILANIAKVAQYDVNKSILRELDPASGSSALPVLQEDFNGLLRRESLKVYTFQEATGKYGLNAFNSKVQHRYLMDDVQYLHFKVVPDDSSSFGFRDFEQRDFINSNHMEMCRFPSRQDDGYRKSMMALTDILDSIHQRGKQSLSEAQRMGEDIHQGLMEKLDFAERTARQYHIDNAEAQAPTFEWIWHITNGQSSFSQWLQSDEPIFWIQGKPGSGKSTLMRYLSCENQKVEKLLKSSSQSSWTTADFFFDFRASQGMANNLEGLLRSLSIQIMDNYPRIDFNVKHLSDRLDTSLKASNLSMLKQIFTELLCRLPENLCVFVDGLDEYQGTMAELLGYLKSLLYDVRGTKMLKMCLASRPEPVILLALKFQPGLTMHEHNRKGINRYVSAAIRNVRFSSLTETRLLKVSSVVARKADGMFLWARFALDEIIKSDAAGETPDELEIRLDALPSDMDEMYVNIFKRMRLQDHRDAQILFQLICCYSRHEPSIRQIKEAYAMASNRFQNSEMKNPGGSIEDFRKRIRAKTGGLLEETAGSKYPGQRYNTIKTIHRSVNSFLDREGWLTNLSVDGRRLTSPESLWVYVCCKYLEHLFGKQRLPMDDTDDTEDTDNNIRRSLFEHAKADLFEYARVMEHDHEESSFQHLETVSNAVWSKFSCQFPLLDERQHYTRESIYVDWETIKQYQETQPWHLMVEQGLHLTVEEALRTEKYVLCPNKCDIQLVLRSWQTENNWLSYNKNVGPYKQLLSVIINKGILANADDIIECLSRGKAVFLELFLRSWPSGKIRLDRSNTFVPDEVIKRDRYDTRNHTYAGQCVGPLWELARGDTHDGDFELILDFLLDRGEDLNEICGPGGTMLHALIIGFSYESDRFKMIIGRGALVDISGPWGTPLQMIWKIVRYCEVDPDRRIGKQQIMRFLRNQGANCDWVEPDGSVVSKAEIDALCSMNDVQLYAQYQPRFKYPDWYTWEALTAEERLNAEADRDNWVSLFGPKQPSISTSTSHLHRETEDESESMRHMADQDEYESKHDSGSLSDSPPSPSFE